MAFLCPLFHPSKADMSLFLLKNVLVLLHVNKNFSFKEWLLVKIHSFYSFDSFSSFFHPWKTNVWWYLVKNLLVLPHFVFICSRFIRETDGWLYLAKRTTAFTSFLFNMFSINASKTDVWLHLVKNLLLLLQFLLLDSGFNQTFVWWWTVKRMYWFDIIFRFLFLIHPA